MSPKALEVINFNRQIINMETARKVRSQIIIITLITIASVIFTSCSEMIEGLGHMFYGFFSFMAGLMEFLLIVVVALVVIGIVVNVIKSIFDK